MSTDYDAVCDKCRHRMHCGQRMAAVYSFGHGSDDDQGQAAVAKWIFEHVENCCGQVRIERADAVVGAYDTDYSDE